MNLAHLPHRRPMCPASHRSHSKVKRVLQKLKSEKLSLNAFIYTVFSLQNVSIRPRASRFFSNLGRAEDTLTAMLSRAKKELLDSGVIRIASLLLAKQLRSLCSHLRRPSSSYTRDSILAWSMSNAETSAQNYAPGLVDLFHSPVSTPCQSQCKRERVEELEQ